MPSFTEWFGGLRSMTTRRESDPFFGTVKKGEVISWQAKGLDRKGPAVACKATSLEINALTDDAYLRADG